MAQISPEHSSEHSSQRPSEPSEHEEATRPHVIVLFGATGDLAKRKLFPALLRLAASGWLPEDYRVIGSGRHSPGTDEEFRSHIREVLAEAAEAGERDSIDGLVERVSFQTASAEDGSDLAAAVGAAEKEIAAEVGSEVEDVRRLIYLSVPPSAMISMIGMLAETSLSERARVVVEKPFGLDLASAVELDAALLDVVDEDQVFRIDHFLGKEAVQNILAVRFANGLFEPAWNRHSIDSVQIDVPEELTIEGRAGFYESTGALRDMISTHLCQLLGFVAMEDPGSFTAKAVRDTKAALFRDVRPLDPARVVLGQYDGYREEPDVAADSDVETFVAAEVFVDNDRWEGVPFLLRTGKALAEGRRTITLRFREPTSSMFTSPACGNELVLELTDEPQITVDVRAKEPGPAFDITMATMALEVHRGEGGVLPLEAYERLLYDVLHGDQTLFTRSDEVERLWEVCQPVLDARPAVQPYAPGSWGPQAALDLAPGGWRLGG